LEEVAILIRKAESKLNTAKILFEEEIYEDAISRAYYEPSRYEAEKIIADSERFLERIKEAIKGNNV